MILRCRGHLLRTAHRHVLRARQGWNRQHRCHPTQSDPIRHQFRDRKIGNSLLEIMLWRNRGPNAEGPHHRRHHIHRDWRHSAPREWVGSTISKKRNSSANRSQVLHCIARRRREENPLRRGGGRRFGGFEGRLHHPCRWHIRVGTENLKAQEAGLTGVSKELTKNRFHPLLMKGTNIVSGEARQWLSPARRENHWVFHHCRDHCRGGCARGVTLGCDYFFGLLYEENVERQQFRATFGGVRDYGQCHHDLQRAHSRPINWVLKVSIVRKHELFQWNADLEWCTAKWSGRRCWCANPSKTRITS